MRRDLGDFQTPTPLAAQVFKVLERLGISWSRVLEPTCGLGRFLIEAESCSHPSVELQGIEIQPDYVARARASLNSGRIHEADFFAFDLKAGLNWTTEGPLLIVGNPPWVTASELGKLASTNGPERTNLRSLSGLEARTGRSNFDLAEAVWIKLIRELGDESPTIALLCKATVARNLLEFASENAWPLLAGSFHRIDARLWFGASVEAGLLRLSFGSGRPRYVLDDFPSLEAEFPSRRIGVVDGLIITDLDAFETVSPWFKRGERAWRQGVKHDAARVLELMRRDGVWINGLGEHVDVEAERIFPMLKSADLDRPDDAPERALILVQSGLNDDLIDLESSSPRLWAYLQRHKPLFDARKSSIYRQRPSFSIFGVGPYTFAEHKVAVSGLHTSARFRPIEPVGGRPVVFDDACYILPCDSREEAERLANGLNSAETQTLIRALTSPGKKRPITKRLLQHLDLQRWSVERPSLSVG